jgi:hypothetical protein
MHKRILVPMDDSALDQALLSCAQSPAIAFRIKNARKAETWISLTRVEGENKPISFSKIQQQIFRRSQTR